MQSAGYVVDPTLGREKLFKLVQRKELGYLCYDKCSDTQLKKFAVNRSLVTPNRKLDRRWLVNTLIEADKNRRFAKLLDLPPELREHVYRVYISDFKNRILTMPSQPPLAWTCRLLRDEVLPFFYSEGTFWIRLQAKRNESIHGPRFRLTDETCIFLSTLAPGSIGDIRGFILSFSPGTKNRVFWDGCKYRIDLSASSDEKRIQSMNSW